MFTSLVLTQTEVYDAGTVITGFADDNWADYKGTITLENKHV